MTQIHEIVASTVVWALMAMILGVVPGVAIAYALSRYRFPGRNVLSTLTTLPLVLPPTAVGYMLLRLFADNGLLGPGIIGFDIGILLSWKAVVIACGVMSFPIFARTAKAAFDDVDPRLEEMGRSLGMGFLRVFFTISIPLASRGLTAAALLGFARALGEFGATIILAGNIPGRTQTLASAIFSAQQRGDDVLAHKLVWVALATGFAVVYATEWISARGADVRGAGK